MSTPISGKDGTVKISTTPVAAVTEWEAEMSVETTREATNESSGAKTSIPGSFFADGKIRGQMDSAAAMTVLQGSQSTLLFYINASKFLTGPSTISKFRITTPINTGKAVGYEATFENNGAWTAISFA